MLKMFTHEILLCDKVKSFHSHRHTYRDMSGSQCRSTFKVLDLLKVQRALKQTLEFEVQMRKQRAKT